jgi:hypothetical protein
MSIRQHIAGLLLVCAAAAACIAPAGATGTVRVQQSDGTVKLYENVSIHFRHGHLRLTSADGKGTLIIDHSACSFINEIERCLPLDVKLDQDGAVHAMQLADGQVFVNSSDSTQQLTFSSHTMEPHSVYVTIRTQRGTYITAKGTIDGGIK